MGERLSLAFSVFCDFDCHFVVAAEGGIDAVVELHEWFAALLDAAGGDAGAGEDAAVGAVPDAVADGEAYAGLFHENWYFAAMYAAVPEGDAVSACRDAVPGVFGGVADAGVVDCEGAVAGDLVDTVSVKKYLHNVYICFCVVTGYGYALAAQ